MHAKVVVDVPKGSFERCRVCISSRCSVKMVFLNILQNSQGNTFGKVSFLIKLQASGLIK